MLSHDLKSWKVTRAVIVGNTGISVEKKKTNSKDNKYLFLMLRNSAAKIDDKDGWSNDNSNCTNLS